MAFKVSFAFSQQMALLGGWTENFWSSLTDLGQCTTNAADLGNALARIHGNTTAWTRTRISDALNPRNVMLVTGPAYTTGVGDPTRVSDYAAVAGLLVSQGFGNYPVRQWLKGLWDSATNTGGFWNPPSNMTGYLNAFYGLLTNSKSAWCLRVLDRTQLQKPIQGISNAGVVTCMTHGYSNNNLVRISRAKGLAYANGLWKIVVIDANTFSLVGFIANTALPPYTGGGVVRLQSYIFTPIISTQIVRATKHNVGRPLGQLIGRRRKRAS